MSSLLSVNVALLITLVKDSKYEEACKVFHGSNTIRLTEQSQLHDLSAQLVLGRSPHSLKKITKLELVNFADATEFLNPELFDTTLHICSRMPKLKKLVIAYDSLHCDTTVRRHLSTVEGLRGSKLACAGIGLFRLRYKQGCEVEYKHYDLMQSWQAMKARPPLPIADVAAERLEHWRRSYCEYHDETILKWYIEEISLVAWVAIFNTLQTLRASHDQATGDLQAILSCFDQHFVGPESANKVYDSIAKGLSFRDLDNGEPDTEMLEGMSDLLSLNARGSHHLARGGEGYRYTESAQKTRMRRS